MFKYLSFAMALTSVTTGQMLGIVAVGLVVICLLAMGIIKTLVDKQLVRHRDNWRKLPTWWIEQENCLINFRWRSGGGGANEIAALMCLILLVHTSESADKDVRITFDEFMEVLSLSRAKVTEGLKILIKRELITSPAKSMYHVTGMGDKRPWGKLPCKSMYSASGGFIPMFKGFKLRTKHELNALKLLMLICSRTSTQSGRAQIGVQKIQEWSGIPKNDVKRASSLLIANGLLHQERMQDLGSGHIYFGYRLAGNYKGSHGGNTAPENW